MFTIEEYLNSLKSDKSKLVTNLNEKGVEASNDETFTTLVPKVSEIISGADLSEYFKEEITSDGSQLISGIGGIIKKIPSPLIINTPNHSASYLFTGYKGIETPTIISTKITNFNHMFSFCINITEVSLFDTSEGTFFNGMFQNCNNLINVPIFDLSSATNVNGMFENCNNLSDTSLDNILQMCININSNYVRAKTLQELGFTSSYYSASRIQALHHYQDFIDAGWTIGY